MPHSGSGVDGSVIKASSQEYTYYVYIIYIYYSLCRNFVTSKKKVASINIDLGGARAKSTQGGTNEKLVG